jgi:hypothetical protein
MPYSPFPAAFASATLMASTAWGCPLCESETGERVRAGIFDADFGRHLLVTSLPFPVLIGIVALIHGGPGPRRRTGPMPGCSPDPCTPTSEEPPWTEGRTAGR